jgi:dTDP-4-dehydrorhamnose 3,5-epimerase
MEREGKLPMPFQIKKLEIEGPLLIEPRVFIDERGFFMETYRRSEFRDAGIDVEFPQDNRSLSNYGVLRGLHYQLHPLAQGKLVHVIRGGVYDVAVDLRVGSPSFGMHIAQELTSENRLMLWIPEGFAHGFLSLEDNTELVYKCTAEYSREHERGILYNSPELAIRWPVPESGVIVSGRDQMLPEFKGAEFNFRYSG